MTEISKYFGSSVIPKILWPLTLIKDISYRISLLRYGASSDALDPKWKGRYQYSTSIIS